MRRRFAIIAALALCIALAAAPLLGPPASAVAAAKSGTAKKRCKAAKKRCPPTKRCTKAKARTKPKHGAKARQAAKARRRPLRCSAARPKRRKQAAPVTKPAPTSPPAAGAPAPATGSDPAPGAPAPPAPSGPVDNTLGVEAHDFGTFVLRLSRTSVPAGNLTIYFRNVDTSLHNLWIEAPPGAAADPEQISGDIGEGATARRTLPVTRGAWRLYCSIPGHGSMSRALTVE